MKKFFHPLLISSIFLFPFISQAKVSLDDTPEDAYILNILSVQIRNVGEVRTTTLKAHVNHTLASGEKISGEHYFFDEWNDLESYEETVRLPQRASVFLSKKRIHSGLFDVCFELSSLGQVCVKIPEKEQTSFAYLASGVDKKISAILKYKLTKVIVEEMSQEELRTTLKTDGYVLIRNTYTTYSSTAMAENDYQIRMGNQKQSLGILGNMDTYEATKPKVMKESDSNPSYSFALFVPLNMELGIVKTTDSESFPMEMKPMFFDEENSLKVLLTEDACFTINFFKVIPKVPYNWLSQG